MESKVVLVLFSITGSMITLISLRRFTESGLATSITSCLFTMGSGLVYWPFSEKRKRLYEEAMQRFEYKIGKLLATFPADKLYVHPIKLSKWQMDLN